MRVAFRNGRIYIRAGGDLERELAMVRGAEWESRWQCHSFPDTWMVRQELASVVPAVAERAALDRQRGDTVPGAKTPPWGHQLEAYWFCRTLLDQRVGAMLAMDMGTGKSKVAVDLVCSLPVRTVLIVCPKTVVSVWPEQFRRHAGLRVEVVPLLKETVAARVARAKQILAMARPRGVDGDRADELSIPADRLVFVTNYDVIFQGNMQKLWASEGTLDMLICDESHRIKAPGGRASRAIANISKRVPYRLAMTGTPMSQGPLDLYAQFRFLQPGYLAGNYTEFKNRYAVMGGFDMRQVVSYRDQEVLSRKFSVLAFQAGADLLDLPDCTDEVVEVELGERARRIYDRLDEDFVADVGSGVVTVSNALARLLRLQQITGGYAQPDGDDEEMVRVDEEKERAIADLLDMAGSEPFVVFCRFRRDLDTVASATHRVGSDYFEVSGRRNDLADWTDACHTNTTTRGKVIGVQIQAGSEGVDLTPARYAAYYSLGFSLLQYLQSRARVRRPGQTRPVTYYHIVAKNTVDERVYQALQSKQDVIKAILDAAKG